MKKIAVVGLGIMGHGVADNFLKQGYAVTVWNRTAEKADDLVAAGAVLAATVREAVAGAEMVFEVTANDESSREAWLGEAGIVQATQPEQYLITCATLSMTWTDELARTCAERGLQFFDMPMTGSRMGAESGQLTLLAGGDRDKLSMIEPDLQAIAKDVHYFGPAGSGMRFKLILNALQAVHMAGLGEALRMAKAAGLDEKLVGDSLAERPGGLVTNLAWKCYQTEPEQVNFSVEWIAKDLGYATDMAKTVPHPLVDTARKLYETASQQGFSQTDWTKINKL